MKNGFTWMIMVCSLIAGAATGVALDHTVLSKTDQPVVKPIQQTCEWREEQMQENKGRTIDCYSTHNGVYMGHVQEESNGGWWNAYSPRKNDDGGIKIDDYVSFKDSQSAQKYVTAKVEGL